MGERGQACQEHALSIYAVWTASPLPRHRAFKPATVPRTHPHSVDCGEGEQRGCCYPNLPGERPQAGGGVGEHVWGHVVGAQRIVRRPHEDDKPLGAEGARCHPVVEAACSPGLLHASYRAAMPPLL